ncbi:hypothetical protein DYB25_014177 [Aphanomyces astaci]|uniref:Uncharacterized protein n=1 Tax=Aphanomyces astaci TaxID=112090 RepID=A0A397BWK5_APHAT|nr:hypothetical protein DYB25_014177 [Aphanomyces astaci]
MPQKPVAYAAEYEFPDENSVAMRRRNHSDAMHQEHMRTMQPPMKKDLTTVPVVKSPNKKKQQLVQEADEAERLSRQISKAPKRVKAKQGLKHMQHQPTKNHQDDPTPEFEFLVLNDIDEAVPMRTAKEIKEHIQSKLPLIHNKAVAYLAKEIKKPDPFHVPRRPFE